MRWISLKLFYCLWLSTLCTTAGAAQLAPVSECAQFFSSQPQFVSAFERNFSDRHWRLDETLTRIARRHHFKMEGYSTQLATEKIKEAILALGYPEFQKVSRSELNLLAGKILLSWDETNFGPADIVHRALTTLRLKAIGVDPEGRPISFAALANEAKVYTFEHFTTYKALSAILLSGELQPRTEHGFANAGGRPDFVYLSVGSPVRKGVKTPRDFRDYLKNADLYPHSQEEPVLVFSNRVLDNSSWSHVNSTWRFGHEYHTSYRPTNLIIHYLAKYGSLGSGEFLFTEPISLAENEFVIVVGKGQKAKTIREILDSAPDLAQRYDLNSLVVEGRH